MTEWRQIENFPNYEISDTGLVRSKNSDDIAQIKKSNGYMFVNLYNHGMKQVSIHRLVAASFIPNPNNLPQVNHINGIKTDNRMENLEWCTASHNARHAYNTGLSHCWNKGKTGIYSKETLDRLSAAHLGRKTTSKAVVQLDLDKNVISEWESAAAAARELGISRRHISKACNGIKYKIVGGYRWEFSSSYYNYIPTT